MRTIVTSTVNAVSDPVRDILVENYGFRRSDSLFNGHVAYKKGENIMIESKKDVIFVDGLDFETDLLIFPSTHKSRSGTPTLSVHSTGVFSDDVSFGGKARTLSHTNACAVRSALLMLNEYNPDKSFAISLEVTHHGPSAPSPVIFVELGSCEKQWRLRNMQETIAQVCYELLTSPLKCAQSVIGFGGPHYAPKFTKAVLESQYAMGHICPRYAIPFITEDMVEQMIGKTKPRPEHALFDKKSTRRKTEIREILEKNGLDVLQI